MKKIFSILGIIPLSLALFSCSNNSNISSSNKINESSTGSTTNTTTNTNTTANTIISTSSTTSPDDEVISIVVYFSASSNTKRVAEEISSYTNSTIYSLEPVEPYTTSDLNYNNQNSRVCKEHNDPNRHVELVNTDFPLFSDASYIYLGAPVWWQEMSWVIDDFVKNNDFSNKTIIPFATSASSQYTVTNLQKLTTNATWLSPKRFSSNTSIDSVHSWIDSLEL